MGKNWTKRWREQIVTKANYQRWESWQLGSSFWEIAILHQPWCKTLNRNSASKDYRKRLVFFSSSNWQKPSADADSFTTAGIHLQGLWFAWEKKNLKTLCPLRHLDLICKWRETHRWAADIKDVCIIVSTTSSKKQSIMDSWILEGAVDKTFWPKDQWLALINGLMKEMVLSIDIWLRTLQGWHLHQFWAARSVVPTGGMPIILFRPSSPHSLLVWILTAHPTINL